MTYPLPNASHDLSGQIAIVNNSGTLGGGTVKRRGKGRLKVEPVIHSGGAIGRSAAVQ